MAGEEDVGLYRKIKCPNCGHTIDLMITVFQLPSRRKRIKGFIQDILTVQEYERFKELETSDKIVFGIGKFHETYGRTPSERELSKFIGLSVQSISKYVNNSKLLVNRRQKRGIDGRFDEKQLLLSDEGKSRYSELTYKLLGY
jgi:DNA-directed RNA polymerase subunit RPC12/RpoP